MAVYPVIMCGGSGTRLWPASQTFRPKQFTPLVGERSLFADTVLRMTAPTDMAIPLIVAGVGHREMIEAELAAIGVRAVLLLEPEGRDSAAAMAVACAWIVARDPQGIAAVVAVDHFIPDTAAFGVALGQTLEAAGGGAIVTLGVHPTEPSSAYGYIRPGEAATLVKPVKAFVEKPDADTARGYIAGGYLWNSGNFVVRADVLLEELDAFNPQVGAVARAAVAQAQQDGDAVLLAPIFREAVKISIDYAVMEKTTRAAVLPIDLMWSDLGAWDAVWAASQKDAAGCVVSPGAVLLDCADTLVRASAETPVVVIGARNLAVVAQDGAVLVTDLSRAQQVKTAVDRLKAENRLTGSQAPFATLDDARTWYDRWLRTSALPLWWTVGADHDRGGFLDLLSMQGEPVAGPRRARVQARQTYVYAEAVRRGLPGPWLAAARHGMDFLLGQYRNPDGLVRFSTDLDGQGSRNETYLYEQAFTLLGLAHLTAASPADDRPRQEAMALRGTIFSRWRHGAGGFNAQDGAYPFQANAHMHLLEASLAWCQVDAASGWDSLAAEIVDLAMTSFIDPQTGILRELFDAEWRPAPGDDGRLLEPGHQFEWAWLLERWGRAQGRDDVRQAARRLFANGKRGVDPVRGVAVNALRDDFTVLDGEARLWPQTEYLKAALLLDEPADALIAARGLRRYLETPALGVWRDRMRLDGGFHEEPAPASSLYHIAGAILALMDA